MQIGPQVPETEQAVKDPEHELSVEDRGDDVQIDLTPSERIRLRDALLDIVSYCRS